LPDWSIGPVVIALLEQLSVGFAEHGLTFVAHPRTGAVRPVSGMWRNITPAMVIALGEVTEDDQVAMRAAGIKLLSPLVSRSPGTRHTDYGNEVWVGRLQAEHLAAQGHRHIGYAQTADGRLTAFSEPRLAGVRQACTDLGLIEPRVFPVRLDLEAGLSSVERWRSLDPPVTAVCAYNDEVASVLLLALNSLGLRSPRDLAVVGVDDTPYAAMANLTTIATHTEVLGDYLVRATVRALAGQSAPRRPNGTRAELIRRGTT
jgi:DNA-binding LacI/PurR family transcriptional regulator